LARENVTARPCASPDVEQDRQRQESPTENQGDRESHPEHAQIPGYEKESQEKGGADGEAGQRHRFIARRNLANE
jgi:hypothetical protein